MQLKRIRIEELIDQNRKKFKTDGVRIIEGLAPHALEELETPTHAFIGGSSGNLREIVQLLQKKNSDVRIVINAISLETVSEVMGACGRRGSPRCGDSASECSKIKGSWKISYDDGTKIRFILFPQVEESLDRYKMREKETNRQENHEKNERECLQ